MDSLEFAIKMEVDGEKYYREQAKNNKGNSLETVFLNLADDERKHADFLRGDATESLDDLESNDSFKEYKNVFEGLDDYKDEIKSVPTQLDVYKMALEREKESIELYEDMLSKASTKDEKRLFKLLIKEETNHHRIIEDMVYYLNRAEEWVEDAEFGLREEY